MHVTWFVCRDWGGTLRRGSNLENVLDRCGALRLPHPTLLLTGRDAGPHRYHNTPCYILVVTGLRAGHSRSNIHCTAKQSTGIPRSARNHRKLGRCRSYETPVATKSLCGNFYILLKMFHSPYKVARSVARQSGEHQA